MKKKQARIKLDPSYNIPKNVADLIETCKGFDLDRVIHCRDRFLLRVMEQSLKEALDGKGLCGLLNSEVYREAAERSEQEVLSKPEVYQDNIFILGEIVENRMKAKYLDDLIDLLVL